MGLSLLRAEDGRGQLPVHLENGVAMQKRVIFGTYINDHLEDEGFRGDAVELICLSELSHPGEEPVRAHSPANFT
jgi:hypothetical protein